MVDDTVTTKQIGEAVMPPPIVIEIPDKPPSETPRCFYEEYEGRQKDLADEIYKLTYWTMRLQAEQRYAANKAKALEAGKEFNDKPVDKDFTVLGNIQVEAHLKAAEEAYKLMEDAEQAGGILIYRSQQKQYFKLARGEFKSLGEWLAAVIPTFAESDGEKNDAVYVAEVLIPNLMATGNGHTNEWLDTIKNSWVRSRAVVPYLRQESKKIEAVEIRYDADLKKRDKEIQQLSMELPKLPEEEKPAALKEIQTKVLEKKAVEVEKTQELDKARRQYKLHVQKAVNVIKNPGIPTNGPNGVRHVLARPDASVVIYEGHKCYVQNPDKPDEFLVMFQVLLPKGHEETMNSLGRNFIDWSIRDGRDMTADIGKLVMPHGGSRKAKKKKKKG